MTAKKYLTECGLQDSHWGKRIIKAEEREYFTDEDKRDSMDWFSCACGKLDKRIGRNTSGIPVDDTLYDLSRCFNLYCYEDDIFEAAKCLVLINKREAELLPKIKK